MFSSRLLMIAREELHKSQFLTNFKRVFRTLLAAKENFQLQRSYFAIAKSRQSVNATYIKERNFFLVTIKCRMLHNSLINSLAVTRFRFIDISNRDQSTELITQLSNLFDSLIKFYLRSQNYFTTIKIRGSRYTFCC